MGRKTALHHAAREGHAGVAAILLNAGADVNADVCSVFILCSNVSPLHLAASLAYVEGVRLLLGHGAAVQLLDALGRGAVYAACAAGEAGLRAPGTAWWRRPRGRCSRARSR